jgi:hypothetical protein
MDKATKFIIDVRDFRYLPLPAIRTFNGRSLQPYFCGSGRPTDATETFFPELAAALPEMSLTVSIEKISATAAYLPKAGYPWKS